jgi:hypothetical protein
MVLIDNSTKQESIGKPQFLEEINQDVCLDCDRFYQVGGRNALILQPINQDNSNIKHQVMTIANPKQCADCEACTSNNIHLAFGGEVAAINSN